MADGKQKLVIVESPAKARTISRYLGPGYEVESSIGHIRDLPEKASQIPAAQREKYGALGVAVEDDFEPYYVVDPDKKKVVTGPQEEARAGGRAAARDGRGPRGRGDRLASRAGAAAQGARAPHGVPRDHEGRDRPRARRDERRGRAARRLAGDAPHPRQALRLRGVAGAVEEGHARPLGRSRAVRRDEARRRPGARAHALRRRLVLGRRRHVRAPAPSKRDSSPSTASASRRAGTSAARASADGSGRRPRRGAGDGARPGSGRQAVRGHVRRGEAVPPKPGRAVPHVHAPAGGEPEAALLVADDDADRPAALRERLHHVHADGLGRAVRNGRACRPGTRGASVRRGDRSRLAPPLRAGRRERAGGARGDPPRRRRLPHAGGDRRRGLA